MESGLTFRVVVVVFVEAEVEASGRKKRKKVVKRQRKGERVVVRRSMADL